MNEYNIRETENYIRQLERVKSSFEEADEYSYESARNILIEKLIEIIEIYDGIIPGIKDLILLKQGTEYRDVESIIGKLKLHVLLKRNDNNKLYSFIHTYINRLGKIVNNSEKTINCYNQKKIESELIDEIMITINIFKDDFPSITDVVLLNNGTAIRDANSLVGKLKLESNKLYTIKYENSLDDFFIQYASDVLGDTNKGLTGTEIVKFTNKYALKFDKDLPITSSDFNSSEYKVPNKRTALLLNLSKFNGEEQFKIISELCDYYKFNHNTDIKKLKNMLYEKYGIYFNKSLTESELIIETEHWLSGYNKAYQQYKSAIEKYKSKKYERNILDDMRLSFELLLKELLKNQKSLENQKEILGAALKENNISTQIRNLIIKVIDYYTKYQNDKVKHDDSSNKLEIEYMIEQTSVLMKFLIQVLDS